MATVTSITAASGIAATGSTSKSTTATSSEELQTRFLKLLTTQLQNQDPLNPMDNAQMTSQLAQLSMVDGLERLNTSMTSLSSSYEAGLASQAVSLIGHTVMVPGSTLTLTNGKAVGGFEVASAADKVVVSILDASGTEVDSVNLGAYAAGSHAFAWDGTLSNGNSVTSGNFSFKVTATKGASSVESTALDYGKVISVTHNASGLGVQVEGLGSFAFSKIRQYL